MKRLRLLVMKQLLVDAGADASAGADQCEINRKRESYFFF